MYEIEDQAEKVPANRTPVVKADDTSSLTEEIIHLIHAESDQCEQSKTRKSSSPRKHGGPRTNIGKQRSSRNALKYGIFAKAVLLPDESRAEFDSLMAGLHGQFVPQGQFEDALVERLAVLMWRQRRLLLAENAEIRKGREFLEHDAKREAETAASLMFHPSLSPRGLLEESITPEVLQECLALLQRLETRIKERGFDPDEDRRILGRIYGVHRAEDVKVGTLAFYYAAFVVGANRTAADESVGKQLPPDIYQRTFLFLCIPKERRRLKRLLKQEMRIQTHKLQVASLCALVPAGPALDRLIRRETQLDRAIERTLNQLERAQRLRRGQPVPAPVCVNVTV